MVIVTQPVLIKASSTSVISHLPSHVMGNLCKDRDVGKISDSTITIPCLLLPHCHSGLFTVITRACCCCLWGFLPLFCGVFFGWFVLVLMMFWLAFFFGFVLFSEATKENVQKNQYSVSARIGEEDVEFSIWLCSETDIFLPHKT